MPNQLLARMREPIHAPIPVPLPELRELDLPYRVPGDHPFIRHGYGLWYLPDGRPRRTIYDDLQWRLMGTAAKRVGGTRLYRDGRSIWVSTTFLGLDHAEEGPPVLWETMVMQSRDRRRLRDQGHCWRYASPEAALHGHRIVCHTIAQTNRARRALRADPGTRRTAPIRLHALLPAPHAREEWFQLRETWNTYVQPNVVRVEEVVELEELWARS